MPESAPAIAAPQTISKPDPDPTVLTTQALFREINQVQALLDAHMDGLEGTLSARITAIDRDVDRLQLAVEQEPANTGALISTLRDLHEEKFKSIQVQFVERDTRTEQTSRDSKVAVDAALQAAKEAVGEQNKSSALAIAKSEASTTKQIDQQGLLIASSTQGLDDKIDDIKDRLTRIEGKDIGTRVTHEDNRGLIVVSIAALSVVFNIVIYIMGHH